jgi:hypothetical protein
MILKLLLDHAPVWQALMHKPQLWQRFGSISAPLSVSVIASCGQAWAQRSHALYRKR